MEKVKFTYLNFANLLLEADSFNELCQKAIKNLANYSNNIKVALIVVDSGLNKFKVIESVGYDDRCVAEINNLNIFEPSLFSQLLTKRLPVNSLNQSPIPHFNQKLIEYNKSQLEVVLPLIDSSNELLGMLLIDSTNKDVIDELKPLTILTHTLANAMKLFMTKEQLEQRLNNTESLIKLKDLCDKENLILDEYLDKSLEILFDTLNVKHAVFLFFESDKLLIAGYRGFEPNQENLYGLAVSSINALTAINTMQPSLNQFKDNLYHDYRKLLNNTSFNSVITVPVVYNNLKLGVIELFYDQEINALNLELNFLTKLGQVIGMSLKNKYLTGSESLASLLCSKTGLLNQVHLKQLLTKEIKRSKRQGRSIGVLCLNIDHLGLINFHLGKQLADRAIDYVAQKIKIALRDIDLLFYAENGEFVIILPETQQSHSLLVAERIKNMVREETCPSVGRITVSVGVASYNESGDTASELLDQANQAMRMAKLEGRDRVKLLGKAIDIDSDSWKSMSNNAKLLNAANLQNNLPTGLEISQRPNMQNKVNNFLAKQRVFKPKKP